MKKALGIFLGLLLGLCLLTLVAVHQYLDDVLRRALTEAGLHNITFEAAALSGYDGVALKNVVIKESVDIHIESLTLTPGKMIRISGLSASFGQVGIIGVAADLQMESFSPPVFTNQAVSVETLAAALPLTNGKLNVSMDAEGKISVHSSDWELAGGNLSSSAFSFTLPEVSTQLILTAKNLDLSKLFEIVPIKGLSLTGYVNGTIPIVLEKGRAAIIKGVLETTKGGGMIRYTPDTLPALLEEKASRSMGDVKAALAAFQYETLKLGLQGEAGKRQIVTLKARGRNPDFQEGRPIVFNIKVEGPLESIVRHSPTKGLQK